MKLATTFLPALALAQPAVYMSRARPTKSDMDDRVRTLVYQALE